MKKNLKKKIKGCVSLRRPWSELSYEVHAIIIKLYKESIAFSKQNIKISMYKNKALLPMQFLNVFFLI